MEAALGRVPTTSPVISARCSPIRPSRLVQTSKTSPHSPGRARPVAAAALAPGFAIERAPKRRRPPAAAAAAAAAPSAAAAAPPSSSLNTIDAQANDAHDDDDDDDDPDTEGGRGSGRFRFFYDEQRFAGRASRCVVPAALAALGGVRTGGAPKQSPVPGPLGWTRPGEWDLLWSPARTALLAAEGRSLRQGQLASALPGMSALTRKRRLAGSLRRAYGEAAWRLVAPRTFELPGGLEEWRAHLEQEEQATEEGRGRDGDGDADGDGDGDGNGSNGNGGSGNKRSSSNIPSASSSSRWMLKTAEHMGKGLALLPSRDAFAAAEAQARQARRRVAAAAARRASQERQQQQQQQNQQQQRQPNQQPQQQQQPQAAAPALTGPVIIPAGPKPFLLAQRYVEDPLLLDPDAPPPSERAADSGGGKGNGNGGGGGGAHGAGRKFGLRLWMVVSGVDPLRAYVFKRGLVLFSDVPYAAADEKGEQEKQQEQEQEQGAAAIARRPLSPLQQNQVFPPLAPPAPPPAPPRAHVTNYAANTDGAVWDLADLERALGPGNYAVVWRRCLRACALSAAAALSSARDERARLLYPPESGFELIGLDFVVDRALRPWLLEANSTPSLEARHRDAATLAKIAGAKSALVRGLGALLDVPGRFDARYAPLRAWVDAKRRAARGGGSAARTAALEREARALESEASAASKALVGSGGGGGDGEKKSKRGGGEAAAAVVAAGGTSGAAAAAPGQEASDAGVGGARADEEEQRQKALAAAVAELRRAEAAGFEPLCAYLPYDEVFSRGWDVPFSAADFALRRAFEERRG